MLIKMSDILNQSTLPDSCGELFPDKSRMRGVYKKTDLITEPNWLPGDFINVDGVVLVFCYDGIFRKADNHPQNPWLITNSAEHQLLKMKSELSLPPDHGYHINKIEKRNYGSLGKIQEEVEELLDAHRQGCYIMQLIELSDLYGAIEGYLEHNIPDIKMHDLKKFSDITKRAFRNGDRK